MGHRTKSNSTRHKFGGPWTEIKLKAIEEYLNFYTNALKNKGFDLWYVDAFAGTGSRSQDVEAGGLFEGEPTYIEERILDGSARKALKVAPPFKHLVFVEQRDRRHKALCKLKQEFEDRDVRPIKEDANQALTVLFSSAPWATSHSDHWKQRAVVFLDPYGMSVRWSTLKLLAESKRADVWYLFPLKAVVQQLANDFDAIDETKRMSLNEIFGTATWEDEFYGDRQDGKDLFSEPTTARARKADRKEISAFVRKRLKTLFTYVSEPIPLEVKSQDFFLLYCLSNNGSAVSLISKGVDHVVKKYTPASRQTSGR